MARWFSIYFPEIKDVYRNPDAVSGLMVIKQAPMPCDISGTWSGRCKQDMERCKAERRWD